MKKKKEVEVPKSRRLLSMAIEFAAQSERLVLLNEVGCVDDVIQGAEQLCVKLGNLDLIAFSNAVSRAYAFMFGSSFPYLLVLLAVGI